MSAARIRSSTEAELDPGPALEALHGAVSCVLRTVGSLDMAELERAETWCEIALRRIEALKCFVETIVGVEDDDDQAEVGEVEEDDDRARLEFGSLSLVELDDESSR
jgi:hypothetical protein